MAAAAGRRLPSSRAVVRLAKAQCPIKVRPIAADQPQRKRTGATGMSRTGDREKISGQW